jgi:hypothetical protein
MQNNMVSPRAYSKSFLNSFYGGGYVDTDIKPLGAGGSVEATVKYDSVRDLKLDVYTMEQGERQAVIEALSEHIAKKLAELLTKDEKLLCKFVDPKQVSDVNPTGLLEAIQTLGLPHEYKLVFGSDETSSDYIKSLSKSAGIPITPVMQDEEGRFVLGIKDRENIDMMRLTDRSVTANNYRAFVDFTFRLPLTDELRAYLPEIKDRYETVKRVRDCMFTGKNPLDD